jgi:hypothetical protein
MHKNKREVLVALAVGALGLLLFSIFSLTNASAHIDTKTETEVPGIATWELVDWVHAGRLHRDAFQSESILPRATGGRTPICAASAVPVTMPSTEDELFPDASCIHSQVSPNPNHGSLSTVVDSLAVG